MLVPYIKREKKIDLQDRLPKDSGELNFLFTDIITDYLYENGKSYKVCNDIIGALEGAKLEFYRRVVAPYEDKKIEENGDVY